MPKAHDIPLKKGLGQHFLRQQSVIDSFVQAARIGVGASVFEIGCGDGVITRALLHTELERLWVFEIDDSWAKHVCQQLPDERLQVFVQDFVHVDFSILEPYQPWIVISALPYYHTWPILHALVAHISLLSHGVVMMQEEVAQKIVKTAGRGYGFPSLFFSYYFEWQLLDKVGPNAFYPPPQVDSRLLFFCPRVHRPSIVDEEGFWKCIKVLFKQPRRTVKNNLIAAQWPYEHLDARILGLRAQQMDMEALLAFWHSFTAHR